MTLVACADDEAYAEELARCKRFYGNERKSRERADRERSQRRLAMA